MLAIDLAHYIIQKTKRANGLSNLELQCYLVIICFNYYREFRKPLLKDNHDNRFIVLGELGIVVESIYNYYRHSGSLTLECPIRDIVMKDNIKEFVDTKIKTLDCLEYWDLQAIKLKLTLGDLGVSVK